MNIKYENIGKALIIWALMLLLIAVSGAANAERIKDIFGPGVD